MVSDLKIDDDYQNDETTSRKIFEHELGHALGLDHHEKLIDPQPRMHSDASLSTNITAADVAGMKRAKVFYECCGSGI